MSVFLKRTVIQLVELNVGRRHPESTMTAVAEGLTTTAKVEYVSL